MGAGSIRRTVVIVSDEPDSAGYTALYVHADQCLGRRAITSSAARSSGTVGRTGNADGTNVPSHLHFELRAPFLLDWTPMGEAGRSTRSILSLHWCAPTPSGTSGRRREYVSPAHGTFVPVAGRVGFPTLGTS